MISTWIFNPSTLFPLFLLLSIAVFPPLVSAIDWGLGPKDPDPSNPGQPAECDYPNNGYINLAFKAPGRSKTVLIADVAGLPLAAGEPYTYCLQTGKSSIYDAFPIDLVLLKRSERWYDDFVARLQKKFIVAAKSEVTLLSRYPLGPRLPPGDPTCHFWWRYAFPALKENPDVTRIILVNPENYAQRRTYWRRGGPDPDPDNLYPEDRPRLPSGGFGRNLNGLLPFLGLGGAGTVPVIGAGEALINGVPGGSAPVHDDSKDKTSEMDRQWMDLPDLDQFNLQNGITSMAPEETTEFPSLDIFQRRARRRRDLFNPSLGKICLDWANVPSRGADGKLLWGVRPTFEYNSMPNPAIGDSLPQGNLQDNQQPRFSPNDYVTVQVTQYARQSPSADPSQPVSDNYRLDITILDPAGQTSGEVKSQDAPSGQDVDITSLVLFSTLHVITGANDNDPISFRLGNNDQQWDSTHTADEHKCGTSRWADGKRQIVCSFRIRAGPPDIPGGETPIDQIHLQIQQDQNSGTGDQPLSP
ncbi:hypothetical protein MMC29_004838 [Sticta canariensis]|nr:hypothetical protein [Sticta canariensis]